MNKPKFRKWMRANNLTVTKLARIMGVSKTAVHYWANGDSYPSRENVRKLVELSNSKNEDGRKRYVGKLTYEDLL